MEEIRYNNIGETLLREKLPNGLTINIVPRPEYSKAFATFTTNYGGADRRFKLGGKWIDTPAGVAHFLEHKMFDMPEGNALNTLSANGASPNAFTSSDITAYHFESTTGFEENLETLLNFVSTAYFTPESVEKEQGIIGQEIRMVEDNPGYVVYNNLLRCLYEHNPVRDSVAGTVESIGEITDKTLYHCHKVFYNPSNMSLAVVGNLNPQSVVDAAIKILPKEAGEIPQRDYGPEEKGYPNKQEIIEEMEVSAPQFLFGSSFLPAPKGKALLKQMLVGKIALRLIMGRSSAFYTRLYAEGLINSGFEYELDYTAGTAMILAGGESRDVSAVMDEFNAEVAKINENGLNAELFTNAKKAQFGSAIRSLGSFSSTAHSLVQGSFSGYCPFDSFEIMDTITVKDAEDFIKENLSEKKLALSIINPISK